MYITVERAAAIYGVSRDWIYRNKHIVKMKAGSRMVRVQVESLNRYFKEREH